MTWAQNWPLKQQYPCEIATLTVDNEVNSIYVFSVKILSLFFIFSFFPVLSMESCSSLG